jgi:O-antigen/teichoic acid export membrane protein
MDAGNPGLEGARGLGRDAAWLYLNMLASLASTVVVLAYAIRRVGTADYGLFVIVSAAVGVLAVLDSSLGVTVTRAVARASSALDESDGDRARREAQAAHTLLVGAGGLVLVAAIPAAIVFAHLANVRRAETGDVVITTLLIGVAAAVGLASAVAPSAARGASAFHIVGMGGLAGAVSRLVAVLALVPHFGVVGLGLAQLIAVVAERGVEVAWMRGGLPWLRLRPAGVTRQAIGSVAGLAAPLLVLGVDSQVVSASDAIVIGAIVGAPAVALYRVGSVVPALAFGALLRGFSVTFPKLAGSDAADTQMALVRFFTRLMAYVAGVGFTCAVLLREPIVRLLLGHDSHDARLVLVLFSVAFALDALPHGLVSLLIARGRSRSIALIAPAELIINVSLTVLLVARFGVVGAGITAVVTFSVLDFVILPLVSRREFEPAAGRVLLGDGALPLLAGGLVATAATQPALRVFDPSTVQLVAGVGIAAAAAVGAGLFLLGEAGRATLRQLVAR